MSESFVEQLHRVQLMASGDPTWDLSDNDCAALKTVVDALLKMTAQASLAAPPLDWQPIATYDKNACETVLLLDPRRFVTEGFWSKGDSFSMPHWSTLTHTFDPTHWMRRPADPPAAVPQAK